MTAATESRDARALKGDREWHGFLTLENCEAMAERIRSMLTGHRFTWVACNEGLRDYFPEVRTGQEVREGGGAYRETLDGGTEMAGFHVADSYGVWGVYTTVPDQRAAYALGYGHRDNRHVKITTWGRYDGGRIEIEHYAPIGTRLYWVIAVEPRDDDDA